MSELIKQAVELGTPALVLLIAGLLAWNNKHMSEHNVTSKQILTEQKAQTKKLDEVFEDLKDHRIASGNGHPGN